MIRYEPKPEESKKGPKPKIVTRSKKKTVKELDRAVRDMQSCRGDYKTR